MLPHLSNASKKVLIKRGYSSNLQSKKLSVFIHVQPAWEGQRVHSSQRRSSFLPRLPQSRRTGRPAGPGNHLGEINKYVNVYFLLNLKAASIKIFDF